MLPDMNKVPTWSTSRFFNYQSPKDDLSKVPFSPLAAASGLWLFGSTTTSLSSAATDYRAFKGHLSGMNGRKEDARKQAETPEAAGAKANSADSSVGFTQSKKTKSDVKLRTNQAPKTQFKVENLPTSTRKQSMSQHNEGAIPVDVQQERYHRKQNIAAPGEALLREKHMFVAPQKLDHEEAVSQEQVFDMHYIRDTILEQEAVFREQVRELHRVHKIQTLLMADMRKKEHNVISHSSGTNIGGPGQSPSAFAINAGRWDCAVGQVMKTTGKDLEDSMFLPDPLSGGSTNAQRDSAVNRPLHEANLFKRSAGVPPLRRTFDLERPPEDDDDEQEEHKHDESFKPDGNCIRFMESPVSGRNESESDISLNLSTGWFRGEAGNDDREHVSKAEHEISRASKRPREEVDLFPFLSTNPESLRDAPLRPTPTVATQSFLGGLWGLQLGRKLDSLSTGDANSTAEDEEMPKKKERHSLNLEDEENTLPVTPPTATPHWLLKAPAAKPPKKAVCQTESSSLNFQHSVSPPRNSTEQGMMKSFPPQGRGEFGSGSSASGLVWDGDRQLSDNPPKNRSQFSCSARRMVEEDVQQPGMRGAYRAPVGHVGPTAAAGTGYGPLKLPQGIGDSSYEALTLYSSWREGGDVPCNSFSHGVFTQNQALSGGFGVQLRSFEEQPGVAAPGLVQVGPALGMGSATFIPESGPGMWFHQGNLDSQIQQFQYQQQQQLASLQAGALSSSRQGPWQASMQTSQSAAYDQGTLYALPAASGPPLAFPINGSRKLGDNPGPNWTSGSVGPPFTPFSIVAPPKPPFKRPPKLLLTHDGTTIELKLVSPEREVAAKVVTMEKSYSGSSEEELGEKRDKGSADGPLNQGRVENGRDVSLRPRGKRERDKRDSITSPLKEQSSPAASDWMVAKVLSSAAHRVPQVVRNGLQQPLAVVNVAMAHPEGMDDADGGSSDAGSGGSGVGDVINPGDRASPSLGTFAAGVYSRNLPAGEGEEGVNMGELGLQADSESQSETFNTTPLHDKPRKQQQQQQEEPQEKLSASSSFGTSLSMTARKLALETPDGSGHVGENAKNSLRGTEGLYEEVEGEPVFRRVMEHSGSSSGVIKTFLHKESHCHGVFPAQQRLGELRNAQLELQQPTSSTSQPRMVHPSKLQGKDSTKTAAASSPSGHGSKPFREQYGGRLANDIDDSGRGKSQVDHRRNISFSSIGDICKQERESMPGHSKQLSEISTSEKDVVGRRSCSPVLRQIPSPSTVDMERHAEGSSKKVSQASETGQGNGRSPLRMREWIEQTSIGQDYSRSPGGIDSSCEEVDGTLVKRVQQGKAEQKGKDVLSPGETYSASLSHKDLGQPDAALNVTDSSSYGMCISSATKASEYATGDSTPGGGTMKRWPTSVRPKPKVRDAIGSQSFPSNGGQSRDCHLCRQRGRESCFCISSISNIREGKNVT